MAVGFSVAPAISKFGLLLTTSIDSTPSVPLPGSVKYSSPRDESRARDDNVMPVMHVRDVKANKGHRFHLLRGHKVT